MIYKDFQDLKLSALGFGAMRLPTVDGKDAEIDKQAASAMVSEAMKKGINYYDTAWGYHEGNSELIMGEILSEYPRDSFYLATKFPGYDLSNMDKVEEIFEKQLEKCRADHFDFYLFHNVCEMNIDAYLDESHGIFAYLMEQKKNGRIKHLGFSAHGEAPVMRRFLEKYGKEMEFCQIQLNYLDLKFQDAQAKLELLKEYEIPVWVMEPLRGGRLANLTEEEIAKLAALRPDETSVSWAFRFLQSIPEVTMILSGMSNMEQLLANIETFETEKSLNQNEQRVLQKIADEMAAKVALPCTECRYCTTHCPQGLDIPYLLSLYNEHRSTTLAGGMSFIAPMALSAVEKEKQPSACIGCGSCEAVCPQQIKISQAMKEFVGALGM
ncbi:oxidoreductase [Anaerotruncus sp. 80]|uniref:Oxidoreductase n=1 Tax=Anaerotruncus colihominis TaxID=169435 RepID=A0A845QP03_9FIRM|nr:MULTISPECIES: aldo/keto reductase [Anaerotruncus]NBH62453.1 oxidoreductase [Anaerotruncus colihominis]NCF03108.1 oxidoreductase [Anaerotruncus sp. 80]